MKCVCITQRVDVVISYGERRDALDQNWHKFLDETGCTGIPLPNNSKVAESVLNIIKPDGVILSGGNNLGVEGVTVADAPERDGCEKTVLDWARANDKIVIGICRGMQFINQYFGGDLTRVDGHVACRHPLQPNDNIEKISLCETVNSFHNFGILSNELGTDLKALAVAPDGIVEAFKHKELPWYGFMWHPEREMPFRESDITLFQTLLEGKNECNYSCRW